MIRGLRSRGQQNVFLPRPFLTFLPSLACCSGMLDSLPEWRRALGRRFMNEVTRLVVVSWGRASKAKKEKVLADTCVYIF